MKVYYYLVIISIIFKKKMFIIPKIRLIYLNNYLHNLWVKYNILYLTFWYGRKILIDIF